MARGDKGSARKSPKESTKKVKKKVCVFCAKKVDYIDYKDAEPLRKFVSERGKIRARRVTGNCDQHQRAVAMAIKNAREMALLPYTQRMVAERTSLLGPRGANANAHAPAEAAVSVDQVDEATEVDIDDNVEAEIAVEGEE